ncbi:MAG TPA: LytTR family DNA-binding domain-containing protein [Opitutaceae bacterium]
MSSQSAAGGVTPALPASFPGRIVLKRDGEFHFVRATDVVWIEAEGDFIKVHTLQGAHLVRQTLTRLAASLDPAVFLRVHRSAIVNSHRIEKIAPLYRGDYLITVTGGAQVRSSRAYAASVQSLLG